MAAFFSILRPKRTTTTTKTADRLEEKKDTLANKRNKQIYDQSTTGNDKNGFNKLKNALGLGIEHSAHCMERNKKKQK